MFPILSTPLHCCVLCSGAVPLGWQASADDPSPDPLWVWELMDLKKGLGPLKQPALKKTAEGHRKRRKEVRGREVRGKVGEGGW